MSTDYRIIGSELSPYSVKVRSYFRFKGLAHQWLVRTPAVQPLFDGHARLPLIPLVITPDGDGLQDSTPIIEAMETRHPEPPLEPDDPALAYLSALIEDYADEWVNKPMFHYRWTYDADQIANARRIAESHSGIAPGDDAALAEAAAKVRGRMVPRLSFVGSSPATGPLIEASFRRLLAIVEAHLAGHDFLFGGRPALADLGLFAQLYECSTDPTPGAIMAETAPRTLAWIGRMLRPAPAPEGAFAAWHELEATLSPLLADEIAGVYLPWSAANAAALAAGEERFSVALKDGTFSQSPQKYHARSLAVLRAKYAGVADKRALDPILEATGCRAFLA